MARIQLRCGPASVELPFTSALPCFAELKDAEASTLRRFAEVNHAKD